MISPITSIPSRYTINVISVVRPTFYFPLSVNIVITDAKSTTGIGTNNQNHVAPVIAYSMYCSPFRFCTSFICLSMKQNTKTMVSYIFAHFKRISTPFQLVSSFSLRTKHRILSYNRFNLYLLWSERINKGLVSYLGFTDCIL